MSDCPHCRRFREERDEAIEALRQARESVDADAPAIDWPVLRRVLQISPTEAKLLSLLVNTRRAFVAWAELADLFQPGDEFRDDVQTLRVFMSRLRKVLRTHIGGGVIIETVLGAGYALSPASKAALRAFIEARDHE